MAQWCAVAMSGAARSWRGDILARLPAKLVLLHSHIWGAAAEAVREKVAVSDLCVRRNGGPGTDIRGVLHATHVVRVEKDLRGNRLALPL